MAGSSNDFFHRMTKEAMEELAGGDKGWREVESNVLILACFGMLYNHLASKISRPLWFFAGSVLAGVVWFIIGKVIGLD